MGRLPIEQGIARFVVRDHAVITPCRDPSPY